MLVASKIQSWGELVVCDDTGADGLVAPILCTPSGKVLASTPGRLFAFTLDLAKIRPWIDCMFENMPPSLINRAHKVSLAFQLIKLLQTCLNFQRQQSSLATRVYKIFLVEDRGQDR